MKVYLEHQGYMVTNNVKFYSCCTHQRIVTIATRTPCAHASPLPNGVSTSQACVRVLQRSIGARRFSRQRTPRYAGSFS